MSQLFGMDEELENEGKNKVETMEEIKTRKRPFAYWKVGDNEL